MKIDANNYSILIGKNVAIVTKKVDTEKLLNENKDFPIKVLSLEKISEVEYPFLIAGLPSELKKYVEEHASILADIKTKYPEISVNVQLPTVGGIMDVYYNDTFDSKELWEDGICVMNLEESIEYNKNFLSGYYIPDTQDADKIKEVFKQLNINN